MLEHVVVEDKYGPIWAKRNRSQLNVEQGGKKTTKQRTMFPSNNIIYDLWTSPQMQKEKKKSIVQYVKNIKKGNKGRNERLTKVSTVGSRL